MKTPPMLIGAALLVWGWLTGFVVFSIIMTLILEGSRLIRARWDLSNDDFRRIWVFCTLLFLAAARNSRVQKTQMRRKSSFDRSQRARMSRDPSRMRVMIMLNTTNPVSHPQTRRAAPISIGGVFMGNPGSRGHFKVAKSCS